MTTRGSERGSVTTETSANDGDSIQSPIWLDLGVGVSRKKKHLQSPFHTSESGLCGAVHWLQASSIAASIEPATQQGG